MLRSSSKLLVPEILNVKDLKQVVGAQKCMVRSSSKLLVPGILNVTVFKQVVGARDIECYGPQASCWCPRY